MRRGPGREESSPLKRVLVVGGGIAGLSAAVHLARAGAAVTVLEANAFGGGRFATHGFVTFDFQRRAWRFPVDHGLHGVWRQYRNLTRLLESVAGAAPLVPVEDQELILQGPSGAAAVEVGARVRNSRLPDLLAPLALLTSPRLALSTLREGPLKYVRAGARVLHATAFDGAVDVARYDDLTVDDFLHDWPDWLKRLFCALTHSGFFLDPHEVSLAAFLTGLSYYSVSHKRDADFTTPSDAAGPGVIEPLVGELKRHGGRLLLSTRARALFVAPTQVSLHAFDEAHAQRLEADAAVLALDPPGLSALEVPAELHALFHARPTPKGVASVAVRLFFSASPSARRATSGIFGDERVDNFFWLDRLQRPFMAWRAATGGAVLECHLYGSRATRALSLSDEGVVTLVGAAAEAGWPELRGQRVFAHVQRNPATHVAFTPGTMRRLPTVETPLPRVALAGDFVHTPWPTLYLERACLTGLLAARHLAPGLGLAGLPEPLRPFDAAPSVARARPVLRALRDRGVFPAARARRA
ncbi:MAG: FAD-dependent oxidoreductase [Myxococcales bacterium]|nr:FAD-dependent oxidoreductase [Myxococcales bacterium]